MNDFNEKLRYSLGQQQIFDIQLLKQHIPKCTNIIKTDIEMDKSGVDYIAEISGGAQILIDAKTRMRGCSKYWNGEPELAIEIWSVVEKKKVGWTFNDNTLVDYILYTFPDEDCKEYFFLPFQLLRKAAIENYFSWCQKYRVKDQLNNGYTSRAVFVPANIVIDAINNAMRCSVNKNA